MKFTLTINLGNAEMATSDHLSAVLVGLGEELDLYDATMERGVGRRILDVNGNTVGSWEVK